MSATATVTLHAFWLASRAAGVVALVSVSASVLLGLAMAARLPRAPATRRGMLGLHEIVALTGLGAITAHALLLLGDPWLHPGAAGITVPFALGYRPLFTGLGVVAGYLAALLGLSFYARRRIGARLWRPCTASPWRSTCSPSFTCSAPGRMRARPGSAGARRSPTTAS